MSYSTGCVFGGPFVPAAGQPLPHLQRKIYTWYVVYKCNVYAHDAAEKNGFSRYDTGGMYEKVFLLPAGVRGPPPKVTPHILLRLSQAGGLVSFVL